MAHFVTYGCPDTADSRKIHLILCEPGIPSSNLFFYVSVWGFSKTIWFAVLILAPIQLPLGTG